MKTKTILFTAIALFLLIGAVGCKKESPSDADRIIGTWKCIGFGDTKTGEVRAIEPKDCEKCYVITFKDDGVAEGLSQANAFQGEYAIKENNHILIDCGWAKIGEIGYDPNAFHYAMTRIKYSYQIKTESLFLYYSDTQYLLFNLLKKGGECEYRELTGVGEIISITDAPKNAHNCPNNPQEIKFRFISDGNIGTSDYLFPNWSDTSFIKIYSGMNPPKEWVDENKLTVSMKLKCLRMELTKGTCTPVIFRFPELNTNPNNYCKQ